MIVNIKSSFIAGAIGAALTNPFECITVNMQTKTDFNAREYIKNEGLWNICTRGIVPRTLYNSLQSIFLFTALMKLGKLYEVELGED
jgi:hypothetical protein